MPLKYLSINNCISSSPGQGMNSSLASPSFWIPLLPLKGRYQLIRIYLGFPVLPSHFKQQVWNSRYEKLRCYFFIPAASNTFLDQTSCSSNKVSSAVVQLVLMWGCNDEKGCAEAIQDWTCLPATLSDIPAQYLTANQMKTDSLHHPVLSFHSWQTHLSIAATTYNLLPASGIVRESIV